MTIKAKLIAATTALTIAAGAIAMPTTASAAPLTGFKSMQIETQAPAVEEVGRKRRGRKGRHYNNGAAAAIGAFAVGAAIIAGAAAAQTRRCEEILVERWSRRHGAYVLVRETRC